MRNDSAAQRKKPTQSKRPTERSEQKVQGHAPGQGQGVKPIVGVWGQSPKRSMRQSLIRRKPIKRCRQKKKKYKFSSSTKQTSKHKPAPLYYPPAQSKIRKERSDFAADKLSAQMCRGWRPRQPDFVA